MEKREKGKEDDTKNLPKNEKDETIEYNNQRRRRNYKQQWLTRTNKYQRDKFGHIIVEVEEADANDMLILNDFDVLEKEKK